MAKAHCRENRLLKVKEASALRRDLAPQRVIVKVGVSGEGNQLSRRRRCNENIEKENQAPSRVEIKHAPQGRELVPSSAKVKEALQMRESNPLRAKVNIED